MSMWIVDHTVVNTVKRKKILKEYNQLFNKKITGEITHSEEIEFQKSIQEYSENELLFRSLIDVYNKGQYKKWIKGQKSGINESDIFVCLLNSESKVRFIANFNESAHDIFLSRKAYSGEIIFSNEENCLGNVLENNRYGHEFNFEIAGQNVEVMFN